MCAKRITIAWQTDKPLNMYGSLAARAEALGFDGVTVYNDLFYQPAWYPLMEMARQTSRVAIGPAAVNPFTCHPLHIAGQIDLLDEVSQGRAYLGLARGAWLDAVGVQPEQPIEALLEAFVAVRHLLRRVEAPLDGRHFPIAGSQTLRWGREAGERTIPFLLGSWGRRTISACLPHIKEVKLGGTANPALVARLRQWLPEHIEVVVGAVTVVDQDSQRARNLARREVLLYLPIVAALDTTITIEPELLASVKILVANDEWEQAGNLLSDDLLSLFALSGSPGQIAEQGQALFAAGASRIEFGTPHGLTPEAGLELLGRAVAPALR